MNLWDHLFYTLSPQYQMDAAQAKLAKAQANQTLSKIGAQAALYGGLDPNTGIDWQTGRQAPSGPIQMQGPDGNFQQVNPTRGGLLGMSVSRDQVGGLLGSLPNQQEFSADQMGLLRRANPDAFMSYDTQQAMLGPLIQNMPPEKQMAFRTAPEEAKKRMADAAFPMPGEMEKMLRAAGIQPGSKEWNAAIQAKIEHDNYIREKDPLIVREMEAAIKEKNASAEKSAAQTNQIRLGNISDDDMTDLVSRYIATGDKTLFTSLARGTQGAANIARFQSEANKQLRDSGKSQRDIEMMMNGIRSAGSTLTSFLSGKNGTDVRRMNTIAEHMDLLDTLSDAMDNGDVQRANEIKNRFSEEFGGTPITDFTAANKSVADEINKFAVGGPGAKEDREAQVGTLSASKTPKQGRDALNILRALAMSQLRSYRHQYEAGTGLNNFTELLSPEVARLLDDPKFRSGHNPNRPDSFKVPNQWAINNLKMNPKLRDQFDEKYGPGSAAKVLGQ